MTDQPPPPGKTWAPWTRPGSCSACGSRRVHQRRGRFRCRACDQDLGGVS